MDYITAEINDVDSMVKKLISSDPDYENAVRFLCTIPGVKRDSAITIISEIGMDMSHFSSSKRLCCWAGLTPENNESAGKKKTVRITRAGVYLKPALVQCAHAAVKSDKSPYYKKKYELLAKRRGKKRAISFLILSSIKTLLFKVAYQDSLFKCASLRFPSTFFHTNSSKYFRTSNSSLPIESIFVAVYCNRSGCMESPFFVLSPAVIHLQPYDSIASAICSRHVFK
jgi:hypothetical protein